MTRFEGDPGDEQPDVLRIPIALGPTIALDARIDADGTLFFALAEQGLSALECLLPHAKQALQTAKGAR